MDLPERPYTANEDLQLVGVRVVDVVFLDAVLVVEGELLGHLVFVAR